MKIVDVSMWKMGNCIEGNEVNNLGVFIVYIAFIFSSEWIISVQSIHYVMPLH
jgi:hypothetical protein